MKIFAIAAAAASIASALPAVAATAPITSVTCTSGVSNCGAAADGFSPGTGTDWRESGKTAFWTSTSDVLTFSLAGTPSLTGLTAIVDTNDIYSFQALVNNSWVDLGTVGLGDLSTQVGVSSFSLSFAAQPATQVRMFAVSGDKGKNFAFAVGEVSFTAAAVPEPTTYALFAAGLGVIGFCASRRRRNEG